MALKRDTQCQGGCGKVRSILCSDSPADWLCRVMRAPQSRACIASHLDSDQYALWTATGI